jgi:hypothetical protein
VLMLSMYCRSRQTLVTLSDELHRALAPTHADKSREYACFDRRLLLGRNCFADSFSRAASHIVVP